VKVVLSCYFSPSASLKFHKMEFDLHSNKFMLDENVSFDWSFATDSPLSEINEIVRCILYLPFYILFTTKNVLQLHMHNFVSNIDNNLHAVPKVCCHHFQIALNW
jgi:hypothetical protein